MALNYVSVTGTFDDGSGTPLDGTAIFTPSQTVYASGIPVVSAQNPVGVAISGGLLGTVHLLATDNSGLSYMSQTGFFYWTVTVTLNGVIQPSFSFFLPHTPSPVDLYALANTSTPGGGGGGSGTVTSVSVVTADGFAGTVANPTSTPAITVETTVTGLLKGNGTAVSAATAGTDYLTPTGSGAGLSGVVTGVTAGDTSIVVGGTSAAPTVETNTLDVIATDHPPAAAWSNNAKKITNVANGTVSTDAAAFGQIPGALPPNGAAGGDLSGSYPNPTVAKINGTAFSLPVSVANGGTGQATQQAAIDALAGAQTSGDYLRGNGSHVVMAAIQAGDVPTLNQSTTGNAATATNLAGGATLPAYLAPAVAALTDGATIAVNAALGNDFRVTIAGNRTMNNPTNPVDGQIIEFQITQDSTGSRTITWSSAYSFGTAGAPTLTTTATKTDVVGFKYNATLTKWLYMGISQGF